MRDNKEYALKKVSIKTKEYTLCRVMAELNTQFNEARIFSTFNNKNIVKHYDSWIEVALKRKSNLIENDDKILINNIVYW